MPVTRGEITTNAAMAALAALANRKNIGGRPFKFFPEFFVVADHDELLKLHGADRGERPGGIAIVLDSLSVLQLTGPDFRVSSSWTPYGGLRVVGTRAQRDAIAGPIEGDWVFVRDDYSPGSGTFGNSGWYRRSAGQWKTDRQPRWRSELNQIRGQIALTFPREPTPFSLVDGEYWLGVYPTPATSAENNNRNKYALTPTNISMFTPVARVQGLRIWHQQYEAPVFTWAGDADANISFTGSFNVSMYVDTSAPISSFQIIIRADIPFPIRIFTDPNNRSELGFRSAQGPFPALTLTSSSPICFPTYIRRNPGLPDRVFLEFNGTINPGVTTITITVNDPYRVIERGFALFFDPAPVATARAAANGIHSSLPVWSKAPSAIDAANIRLASKIKAMSRPLVELPSNIPFDYWYHDADVGFRTSTPGFWLVRFPMIASINLRERGSSVGIFDKLKLAPYAEDEIRSTDGTVVIGGPDSPTGSGQQANPGANAIPIPRAFFRKSTDNPNSVQLSIFPHTTTLQEGITPGSTIRQVVVRRRPLSGPSVDWQPQNFVSALPINIGCIRNGAFVRFTTLVLDGAQATIYPDWPIFTAHSLCYECDEEIDIQAQVCMPDPVNAVPTQVNIPDHTPLLADFYNDTERFLNSMPDG